MSKILVPDLKPRKLSPSLLLLDPNNPRLHTHEDDRVPKDKYDDFERQKETYEKMCEGRFNIPELVQGIEVNGFIPVDHVFVRKYRATKRFLVLEGNRRVTAIKMILSNIRKARENGEEVNEDLENQLTEIKVMQIVDEGPEEEIRKKITYLLGVRHHGSLKKWSAFARAKNVYLKYLDLCEQTPDTFAWDEAQGEEIAHSLSITKADVEFSLRTYVAMSQLAAYEPVKKTSHGMQPKWFSLFRDSLGNKKLETYLPRDDRTFRLSDEAVRKYDLLCSFSEPSGTRSGGKAPIKTPQEWAKLGQLCEGKDATPAQREENMRQVEVDGIHPSVVLAKHKERVNPLTWPKWLESVNSIISDITMADDTESEAAKNVTTQLVSVLTELDSRDVNLAEEK